jgi:WD40 repeat protein
VAFARDGTVLTGGEDGRCWLWDADSGAARRGLDGHTGPVRDAVFSADGRWILTASDDRTARIWNAETGTATETLSGHTQAVLCAAFSTDGRRAITGGADNVAIVWQVDPDTGKARELLRLRGHTASVNSVALSPDGRRALTGSDDRTAKLWDARDKRQILVELYNDEELAALAESGIDLDDLLGGEEMEVGQEILTLRGHSQEVTAVAFAPDGLSALTGSRDGKVIVWFAPEDAQAGYRPPGLTSSPAPR